MSLFSQRKGIKPLQKEFQREVIDAELRNRLWSALKIVLWNKYKFQKDIERIDMLADVIWVSYFKLPIDTRQGFHDSSSRGKSAYIFLREYFFDAEWYEVYDFIEFVIKHVPEGWANELMDFCNTFLEDENAAYRILGDEVVEITDKTEIEAIESALDLSVKPVVNHFKRALELLADKKDPDYRNSIKESISAVEACCQYIANDPKATLGDALKRISAFSAIHPALEKGLLAIYGYTSDSGGIRHALVDKDQTPSYADAKFMLVACSGFVNFLITKSAEAGIKPNKK